MKIVVDLKEGLNIIEEYYKNKGYDVKSSSLLLERTGRVRNLKFEIDVNNK